MFRQLLYTAGGGILSNRQKTRQKECVTLAIGLGGTGIDCLRNLKRRVYETLQPDDPRDPVPSYSHIRFLAVDTDRSSMRDDGKVNPLDEERECFNISAPNMMYLPRNLRVLAEQPELRWLNAERLNGIINNHGGMTTCAIRQIGRLLLILKSDAFVTKVAYLIQDAKRGLPKGVEVNVQIFSGLCGGAGSGMLLDVCYLVQRALEKIGEKDHAVVCGYFFLPDVNLGIDPKTVRQDIYSYLSQNGYAAMKELDYCMNFAVNGGEWDQEYCGFHIGPTKNPPVQLCHLISAGDMYGRAMEHGYDRAMDAVGDYVLQFLADNELHMKKHCYDCNHLMKMPRDHGANYNYVALGVSRAVVSVREILTYLGSKLFDAFPDAREKYPTDEEVEQLAAENRVDLEGLMHLVMNGMSFRVVPPRFEERYFRSVMNESDRRYPNELNLPDEIVTYFRSNSNRIIFEAERNMLVLTREWDHDNREGDTDESVIRRVFSSLEQAVCDPCRGPYYAAAVLDGSRSKSLVSILAEIQRQVWGEIQILSNDLQLRIKSVEMARGAYLYPRFMQSRQKLFNSLIEETAGYYELTTRIEVLERMEDMLRRMTDQFRGLYSRHFKQYCRTYSELLDTFRENVRAISDGAMEPHDPFTIQIPELNAQTIGLLDQAVENLDPNLEARSFNSAFFRAYDVWSAWEESRIVRFVSDYVLRAFDEYVPGTIAEHLEKKFGTTDKRMLTDLILIDILRPLNNRCVPLLRKSPSYDPRQGYTGYISIPGSAPAIHDAADRLTREQCELVRVNGCFTGSIFMLRCLAGVPMFRCYGTDQYKEIYRHWTTYEGRHIYEGAKGDPRDWRELPDLIPYSMTDRPTREMLENEKMYRRAVDAEIIRRADPSFYGRTAYELVEYEEPEDQEEIENLAKEAIVSHDFRAANEVLERTKAYLQSRMPVRTINIPNDGANGREEIVRLDHVMGSPALLKAIRRQLEILDDLYRIETGVEAIAKERLLKKVYCDALFTGVIEYFHPRVTCTLTAYGMSEEVKLSDPSIEPYGRTFPLYQGFVTYLELNESAHEYIRREVEERMGDPCTYEEQIKGACDCLEGLMQDDFMEKMHEKAMRFPDKASEIMEFYMNLRREFRDFREGAI